MSLGDRLELRRLRETDSWVDLTSLLHRAYAPLAAEGMRFFATHRTEQDTRKHALAGECFVATVDGGVRHRGRADGQSRSVQWDETNYLSVVLRKPL